MRAFQRLMMASEASITPVNPLRPPPVALLPPIPLYRRILRVHRKLPPDQRLLGDKYVRSEFRAHRNIDNPVHIVGFLTEWQMYAQQLEGDTWRADKLDKSKLDKMSDQQLGQLYELMQAIRKRELSENDPEYEGDENK